MARARKANIEKAIVEPGLRKKKRSAREGCVVTEDINCIFDNIKCSREIYWTKRGPQTDADINALLTKLTMATVPVDTRKTTNPKLLLQRYASTFNSECQLQSFVLAGACSVAVNKGFLTSIQAKNTIRLAEDLAESTLLARRTTAPRVIRSIDMLHQSGLDANRAYEFLLRRENCLSRFAIFSAPHIVALEKLLQSKINSTADMVYKPRKRLNSTRLRIPQLIQALFGGRFTLETVENSLQMRLRSSKDRLPPMEPVVLPSSNPRPHNPASFFQFVTLNQEYVAWRETSLVDLVTLGPTVRRIGAVRYNGRHLFPELCGIAQAHASDISSVLGQIGLRVVDFNGPGGESYKLSRTDGNVDSLVPHGFMGIAVLLCKEPVDVLISGTRIFWEPTQMLCFRGTEVAIDGCGRQCYFFLMWVEIGGPAANLDLR